MNILLGLDVRRIPLYIFNKSWRGGGQLYQGTGPLKVFQWMKGVEKIKTRVTKCSEKKTGVFWCPSSSFSSSVEGLFYIHQSV